MGRDAPHDEVIRRLRADPVRTALLFDFDGTLAPVVDDPAAARPAPGVPEVLEALAARYRTVAAISGRPVAFLAAHLPPTVRLSGLYGLEARVGEETVDHPDAARWRPVVADAVARAEAAAAPGADLHGAVVEPKGLSLTIHTRTRPDLEAGVAVLAREVAAATGLDLRAAKRSVELHPPIAADKGTALRLLLDGCDRALFAGDDVGDLAAFDALGAARAEGALRDAVALAVGGPELPDEVAQRAELVVDDPAALVDLLRHLVV
ncbi:MAG: trehalose-phosphatase [Acidimicrobiales bacterium]|nr:trehalose-phosphatase [Acidimicrobiales bacterium]